MVCKILPRAQIRAIERKNPNGAQVSKHFGTIAQSPLTKILFQNRRIDFRQDRPAVASAFNSGADAARSFSIQYQERILFRI